MYASYEPVGDGELNNVSRLSRASTASHGVVFGVLGQDLPRREMNVSATTGTCTDKWLVAIVSRRCII